MFALCVYRLLYLLNWVFCFVCLVDFYLLLLRLLLACLIAIDLYIGIINERGLYWRLVWLLL